MYRYRWFILFLENIDLTIQNRLNCSRTACCMVLIDDANCGDVISRTRSCHCKNSTHEEINKQGEIGVKWN